MEGLTSVMDVILAANLVKKIQTDVPSSEFRIRAVKHHWSRSLEGTRILRITDWKVTTSSVTDDRSNGGHAGDGRHDEMHRFEQDFHADEAFQFETVSAHFTFGIQACSAWKHQDWCWQLSRKGSENEVCSPIDRIVDPPVDADVDHVCDVQRHARGDPACLVPVFFAHVSVTNEEHASFYNPLSQCWRQTQSMKDSRPGASFHADEAFQPEAVGAHFTSGMKACNAWKCQRFRGVELLFQLGRPCHCPSHSGRHACNTHPCSRSHEEQGEIGPMVDVVRGSWQIVDKVSDALLDEWTRLQCPCRFNWSPANSRSGPCSGPTTIPTHGRPATTPGNRGTAPLC